MITLVEEDIERYVQAMTQPVDSVFNQLEEETYGNTANPEMQVGKVEGTFLRMMVAITRSERVLELGTFTGYSALMMASALPENGLLFTLEIDEGHLEIARRYFSMVDYGSKIIPIQGDAVESLGGLEGPFDLVFIDADKMNYGLYYEMVLGKVRPGGLIIFDNLLRKGGVVHPKDEVSRATSDLNLKITQDERVENVLLTIRDGIMLVRKK